MATVIEKITTALEDFNQKKKSLTEELRKEFPGLFTEFFAKCPSLESFGWSQYTPYFNDGDECVFGVNQDELYVNGEHEDEHESLDWRMRYEKYREELSEKVDLELFNTLGDIKKVLASIDNDFYKDLFGDHVKVTVRRTGEIEVEEYEHD